MSNTHGNELLTDIEKRDINFYQEIYQQTQKSECFEPQLNLFKPPSFPTPLCHQRIIGQLGRQKFILLGGDTEDKAGLCRYFAWAMSESLAPPDVEKEGGAYVKEWQRSTAPPKFPVELQQAEAGTIFVLPNITPPDVNHDLHALQEIAASREQYVIAYTEASKDEWENSADVDKYWLELPADQIYGRDELANKLANLLESKGDEDDALEEIIGHTLFERESPLVEGAASLEEVADELKTIGNIKIFVQLLCAEANKVDAKRIRELVALAQSSEHTIKRKFRTLSSHDQLLTLGMSFFDGLSDDQCFAAFGELVEQAWHRRDESLRCIDYCDLYTLSNFFKLAERVDSGTVIQGRLPRQRSLILKLAWNSHRRQVLSAIPVITRLVKNTARGSFFNQQLYGNWLNPEEQLVKQTLLYRALSDTLSDLGLKLGPQYISATESALLDLATDGSPIAQAVAAQMMAHWYELGKEQEDKDAKALFVQALRILRLDAHRLDSIQVEDSRDDNLAKSVRGTKEDWVKNIRTTMSLTIGYAAATDRPNEMSEDLYVLLEQFLNQDSGFTFDRFQEFTLPIVVRIHAKQLHEKDMLAAMLRYSELIPHIAASLAAAYRSNPGEVSVILDDWHKRVARPRPANGPESDLMHTNLSATLALTYGYLGGDEGTTERAFELFKGMMLENLKHPGIRWAVIHSVGVHVLHDFDRTAEALQAFVSLPLPSGGHSSHVIAEAEENFIIGILQLIHFNEYEKTKDPSTRVRRCMASWRNDMRFKKAGQIANRVSLEVTAVDIKKRKLEEREKEREESAHRQSEENRKALNKTIDAITKPKAYRPNERSNLYLRFVSLVLPSELSERVANNFPPLYEKFNSSEKETVWEELKSWKSLGGEEKEVAVRLEWALWLHENPPAPLEDYNRASIWLTTLHRSDRRQELEDFFPLVLRKQQKNPKAMDSDLKDLLSGNFGSKGKELGESITRLLWLHEHRATTVLTLITTIALALITLFLVCAWVVPTLL